MSKRYGNRHPQAANVAATDMRPNDEYHAMAR